MAKIIKRTIRERIGHSKEVASLTKYVETPSIQICGVDVCVNFKKGCMYVNIYMLHLCTTNKPKHKPKHEGSYRGGGRGRWGANFYGVFMA